jgi:hypothetical protein
VDFEIFASLPKDPGSNNLCLNLHLIRPNRCYSALRTNYVNTFLG